MQKKPNSPDKTAQLRGRAKAQLLELGAMREYSPMMADLYRRAEAQLRKRKKILKPKPAAAKPAAAKSVAEPQRLLHELQVHQVELEMQNAELQETRNRMEVVLEKYTDLYDFAPVGYFSLDEQGRILEMNLTGAAMLGVERSRLANQRLPSFADAASRPAFVAFLGRVFGETGKQHVCEAALCRPGGATFWAGIHGTSAFSASSPKKWCRVAVSDITSIKQAEVAQHRIEILGATNLKLRKEIIHRQEVEESLVKSERHQRRLLEKSRLMQEQLRNLSRQVLHAQEEERKRVSRELHDVIGQTLTGINIRLAAMKKEAGFSGRSFGPNIARTQRMVEKSVSLVQQFARELRPAVLDDLGLIPALHSYMKAFAARTGVRAHLTAFAGVKQLDTARRTMLYRVAQEALTNVSRHARAGRVEVVIQKLADRIRMEISDDGKSFHVDRMLRGRGNKHLGILGMRERVEMVGGTFSVESVPGQGTTVRVEIPFANARKIPSEKPGNETSD
jgi:PAS domain S-box-containing protein